MRAKHLFLSAALAVGLAVGTPAFAISLTTSNGGSAPFGPDDFAKSANRHPIPVVVQGSAFGLDHATLSQTVADGMQGSAWGSAPRFVPQPGNIVGRRTGAEDQPEYSVVMLINGPRTVSSGELCANPARRVASSTMAPMIQPRQDVQVSAALCRYNQSISSVDGWATDVSGPDDPQFHQLLAQATTELTSPTLINDSESIDDDR